MSETAPNRLPAPFGSRLDRSRPVRFTFEGRAIEGLAGDTIASALAANGIRTLSRSFKYRRPRGILTMAGHDANSLVQLPGEPNVPADTRAIEDGLVVHGQNYEGSLEADKGARIEWLSRFLPVGFYYKAFFRPAGAWRRWEPVFRARAGLGAIDTDLRYDDFDKAYGFCDVAVIGGGPAGLAAATTAAEAGAEVLLIDDQPALGGALDYARFGVERGEQKRQLTTLLAGVQASSRITVMSAASCQGWFADNFLSVVRGERLHKIRAKKVVLTTGALEQPIVFRNNDLPGVMMPSAAQRLIRQYGVRPGTRAVVATASQDGYAAALDLIEAGIEVALIADLRHDPSPSPEAEAVAKHGVLVVAGHTPSEAKKSRRRNRGVGAVTISPIIAQGRFGGGGETIACDLLCVSGGYVPAAQLACHAGAKLVYDRDIAGFRIEGEPEDIIIAGSANGTHELAAVIAEGRYAGWTAAGGIGLEAGSAPSIPAERGRQRNHAWPIFGHPKGKAFVDFDEDLDVRDLQNAVAEGFEDIELLKRYSTVGMGPSQGRHSALAATRLAGEATGREADGLGPTTTRPPVSGETLGALAGKKFEPVRHTAMHHRHLEAGAQMMVAGAWMRPAYYAAEQERDRAIAAEAMHVRNAVGLIDVSTLGGIEIRGADAAEFMNRMYSFAYLRQEVGKLRYVLMCEATGAVIDDGVACRLAEDHFYVTATTGGVERVWREMLWHNAQWRLEADVAHVTSAWCGINIAGPRAREVLSKLVADIDLSAAAFPYLGVRTGHVADIPARLLRVGFVGELGFEVHAPASFGEALWDRMMEAGADADIRPFGVEAQRLLRLEKGHVIIGQDTDGLTTPAEADMAWAVARNKPFFVGGRAIEILGHRAPDRLLVGFVIEDPRQPPPDESCLVIRDGDIVGRVTSSMRSPNLDKVIGLAYVAPEDAEPGKRFSIKRTDGEMSTATVASLPFFDPENARQEL